MSSVLRLLCILLLLLTDCTSKNSNDSKDIKKRSSVEKCLSANTESCAGFNSLIKLLENVKEQKFLGFDGQWEDCDHPNHNYDEFFTRGNQMIELKLSLIDTTIHYSLHYLHRDIREVWGTETIEKEIKSKGVIAVNLSDDLNDLKMKFKAYDLNDLLYMYVPSKPQELDFEIFFYCKTCLSGESFALYPKETFKKVLVGSRLHLWDGYY